MPSKAMGGASVEVRIAVVERMARGDGSSRRAVPEHVPERLGEQRMAEAVPGVAEARREHARAVEEERIGHLAEDEPGGEGRHPS